MNEFTREYTIIDLDTGHEIYTSSSKLHLNDINSYMKYALDINSLSNVYYNITRRCNLNCIYCYSEHNKEYISLEDNDVVLKNLKQLNTRAVTLIGGEPFCHPNFYELLESVEKQDFVKEICIVTNGTLINEEHLELFMDPRLFLQISLDGIDEDTNAPTRGKGVYAKVIKNIELLQNNNIQFKVMKVITRQNIDDSIKYFDFYSKMGISTVFLWLNK